MKIWISALSIIFIIAGVILVYIFSNSITKSIIGAVKYLSVVSTGDLTGTVPSEELKHKG